MKAGRPTPVVPWPGTVAVDAHVRAEQLRGIFQQAAIAQVLSLFLA